MYICVHTLGATIIEHFWKLSYLFDHILKYHPAMTAYQFWQLTTSLDSGGNPGSASKPLNFGPGLS